MARARTHCFLYAYEWLEPRGSRRGERERPAEASKVALACAAGLPLRLRGVALAFVAAKREWGVSDVGGSPRYTYAVALLTQSCAFTVLTYVLMADAGWWLAVWLYPLDARRGNAIKIDRSTLVAEA